MADLEPIYIDPKTFLYDHCTLPAFPAVLTELQEVFHSGDANLVKVSELISQDPGMAAHTLKIVNSAFYSLPSEITKIKTAVAYLGLNEIYHIVLSVAVVNALATKNKKAFNEIWHHSAYTALCAKHLTRRFEPLLAIEEIWPAAILHDVGKLVYLKFFPDHYRELTKYAREKGCLLEEAEEHFELPTSAYLGELLCERWRLPGKVKMACQSHALNHLKGAKENNTDDIFTRIISAGNLIAHLLAGELNKDVKVTISDAIKETFKLEEESFLLLMGECSTLKEEAERFSSLP